MGQERDHCQLSLGGNNPRGQWLVKVVTLSRLCCGYITYILLTRSVIKWTLHLRLQEGPFYHSSLSCHGEMKTDWRKEMAMRKQALLTPRNKCSHSLLWQVFTCAEWTQSLFIKPPLCSSPGKCSAIIAECLPMAINNYYWSLTVSAAKLWNNLPCDLRSCKSLTLF